MDVAVLVCSRYLGFPVGMFIQKSNIIRHVLLHILGNIHQDAILSQRRDTSLIIAQVDQVRVLARTDHRVEIVRLGTGNGRLECKVDFLSVVLRSQRVVLHIPILIVQPLCAGMIFVLIVVRTVSIRGDDPPGKCVRVAAVAFAAAAGKSERPKRHRPHQQQAEQFLSLHCKTSSYFHL